MRPAGPPTGWPYSFLASTATKLRHVFRNRFGPLRWRGYTRAAAGLARRDSSPTGSACYLCAPRHRRARTNLRARLSDGPAFQRVRVAHRGPQHRAERQRPSHDDAAAGPQAHPQPPQLAPAAPGGAGSAGRPGWRSCNGLEPGGRGPAPAASPASARRRHARARSADPAAAGGLGPVHPLAPECLGAAAGDGGPAAGRCPALVCPGAVRPRRRAGAAGFNARARRAGLARAGTRPQSHAAAPATPDRATHQLARGGPVQPACRPRHPQPGGLVHVGRPAGRRRACRRSWPGRTEPDCGLGLRARQRRHGHAGQCQAPAPRQPATGPCTGRRGRAGASLAGVAAAGRRAVAAAASAAQPACLASGAARQRQTRGRLADFVGDVLARHAGSFRARRRPCGPAPGHRCAQPATPARPRWLAQCPRRSRAGAGRMAAAGRAATCLGALDGADHPGRRLIGRQCAARLAGPGSPARP